MLTKLYKFHTQLLLIKSTTIFDKSNWSDIAYSKFDRQYILWPIQVVVQWVWNSKPDVVHCSTYVSKKQKKKFGSDSTLSFFVEHYFLLTSYSIEGLCRRKKLFKASARPSTWTEYSEAFSMKYYTFLDLTKILLTFLGNILTTYYYRVTLRQRKYLLSTA
jgi:hypothetical protein